MNIKIGTRGSKLALAQTNFVVESLKKIAPDIHAEICVIKTSGDIMQDVSLLQIGGQGAFVKEIEEALLSGNVDLCAQHERCAGRNTGRPDVCGYSEA